MKRILSTLYRSSPEEIAQYVARKLRFSTSQEPADKLIAEISAELQREFEFYKTSNLKGITSQEFTRSIQSRIGAIDTQSEGYSEDEIEKQRDLSLKFHWGHNHDFGDFKLQGRMADRHINLLANFIALFPVSLEDFRGKHIFDIGCWTGGTSLLLATLAEKVCAIEEVKKYAETATFLAKSFGVDDKVSIKPQSVYECNSEEFQDKFDVVYFPGVLYHLSDPLLALRILFNSLKIGGFILVESGGIKRDEPFCRFDGSLIYHSGNKQRLNRGGWNWFMPSASALFRMMKEAGFEEIQTLWHDQTNRVFGYGVKVEQIGICKAGLSVPTIK